MKKLPEEMMTQILERLPVKYLLRCMCVQKSWYSLIKSPDFANAHLNYQKTHHNYLLFRSGYETPLSLHVDNINLQCEEYDILSSPPIWPGWYGVSNGLICLSNRDASYNFMMCLWNPAIRKFKKLPDPPWSGIPSSTRMMKLAFGFCPKANDFRVVRIVKYGLLGNENSRILVDVYSLSKNYWKTNTKNLISTDSVDYDSVFLNGIAFFRGRHVNKEFTIVSYDTDKDMMRLISLPESCELKDYVHYSVKVYGKSIALFTGNSCLSGFDMWLLKESGTNEVCWVKKISINLPETTHGWSVLGMRSNGEVLLVSRSGYGRRVVSKNVEKDEIMDFEWVTRKDERERFNWDPPLRCVNSFVESLVLINT